jgi:hypothetical protein
MKSTPNSSVPSRNSPLPLPHLSARSVKSKSLSVRWLLRFGALFSLLLVGLPAQAANYVFSDGSSNLPAGCTYVSPGIYSCGVLTLGAGDTISIGGTKPATITFTGALTTGSDNLINAGGLTSELNLVMIGVLNLGVDTIMNANVTASAAVNLGIGSTLDGNLTTASPTTTANVTGIVTLAADSSVSGYILTDAGAVTVGIAGSVGGSITTTAGVVTLGADCGVGGAISTVAGAVNAGDWSRTVGGGITTEAGVVTLTTNVRIDGDIRTIAGGITIGDSSSTCGSVISTGAGVITLTTNVKIGGSISSVAGAITVGSGSRVGGDVIPTGAGVVTLTAVHVGGQVATIAGAITVTDSRIGGSVEATGAGVVTITNSMVNDTTLVVPPSPACSPINQAPVALARNVIVPAGANCSANVTVEQVDAGSSDPDGDSITLAISPVGPYSVGTTALVLTVTDSQGNSSSSSFSVTVNDVEAPKITINVTTPSL